ncbi:MAG: glycosyltransferase family 4 protein [Bacteroidales bacterium]|jgi:glycosyltransferase involved in cell wall biosynthesis|nr:glycosyltransferase family 4 protein [Bacteroidales bacterium]
MNILQIANKAIFPPDGGSLAILSLTKAYIRNGHKVHLLNMITHKHFNKNDIVKNKYENYLEINGVSVNTKIYLLKLFFNFLFSNKPYISQRFISKKFDNKLEITLNNNSFDFVQIEGLYVLQYIKTIRKNFKGKILYRSHNIESLIWKRNYEETSSNLKKIYFRSLFKRLQKFEKSLINTYDYLIPISQTDATIYNELGNIKPVLISPFGVDFKSLKTQIIDDNLKTEQSINYIGALDWIPNQEGLIWFIDQCMPELLKSFPQIKLHVAGRNAPKWLRKKLERKNILFLGEVNNAYEFMLSPGPMIVPLFSGSGMRVKIIEGMALKKAIIATNIAADGINCLHNENIILANNINDFVNSTITLINNPDIQNNIGENAHDFVQEHFDFEKIGSKILNFIR